MESSINLARTYSLFIDAKLKAQPDWEPWLGEYCQTPVNGAVITEIFYEGLGANYKNLSEPEFLEIIRVARQKIMLVLGVRDLAMHAPLDEIMTATTHMAELALEVTAEYYVAQLQATYGKALHPDQEEMKLWVIGMGKLGGRELNVSSDIDLIFVYDSDGQTRGGNRSISHHEWFTLLGKKLIKGLTELTAAGFVFRVDMRLRPNGDSGPLVCSLRMLEEYFYVQGREWERYAWIKARLVYPLADDDGSGMCVHLSAIVKPFVYRKYLDYGIIDAVRNLHHQIRYEANLRATQFPDRSADIKLGVGGIREIEFLAQMFQLIRGGRETSLQVRPTVKTLQVVKDLGYIVGDQVEQLLCAYEFYRKLEHRLQWWGDAQIHYLPIEESALQRVAQSMGFPSSSTFLDQLKSYQVEVAKHFSDAFTLEQQPSQEVFGIDDLLGVFNFYPEFKQRYENFLQGARYQLGNESAKQNLQIIFLRISEIQPNVTEKVLIKFLDLIEVILRRSAYLSLLREYPKVIERVLFLIKESQWGADYLKKHPHLLDEFIQNTSTFQPEQDPEKYWNQWQMQLRNKLHATTQELDSQDLVWNILRDNHHAETFQTLLADLGITYTSHLSVEQVSDRLSTMADIVIQETLSSIWSSMCVKQVDLPRDVFAAGFGVIAYGKLGGKELGYGSDLDLVFVYDDKKCRVDDDLIAQFLKLVRRFISCCTTVTNSGILFEIDTRLRPNGVAGLMLTSLDTFEAYQLQQGSNAAWVWEHQALTRARFCAGSDQVQARFEEIRAKVIGLPRDPQSLRESITQMRLKIHEGHPNRSAEFDLKHDAGGMVDIEFMIQWMVLCYAHQFPALQMNVGNLALLAIAANLGILAEESATTLAQAYRLFRKKQHQLRLDGHALARVPATEYPTDFAAAQAAVKKIWEQLMVTDTSMT